MMMMKPLSISAAFLAIAAVPTALSAQLNIQKSPVPRYHLVQISVDPTKVGPTEFKAKTEAIRDCGDAADLAKTWDADFVRNRHLTATMLPEPLRERVEALDVGHATEVFTNDGSTLRVLVLCNYA